MGRPEGRSTDSGPAFSKALTPSQDAVVKATGLVWANGLVKIQVLSAETSVADFTELKF